MVSNVIAGFTDCNAFRARGIPCYGFSPIRIALSEMSRVHGRDERVAVAALARAVVDMARLVQMPEAGTIDRGDPPRGGAGASADG